MSEPESGALIQKIAGGDTAAMMSLYDRTSGLLFGLISRILTERNTAEEVLLEVYTRVWRKADACDPRGGTHLAWMMEMARACAIDRLRLDKPDRRISEPVSDDGSMQLAGEEANIDAARQQLHHSASEVAPPDYIRDLLTARIEREPRAAATPAPESVSAADAELKHAEPFRPAPPPPPRRRSSILPWLLAAAFAAAAAAGFFLWWQAEKRAEQAVQWERDAAHAVRAEADLLKAQLESEKARNREIAALDAALSSPSANLIFLAARRPDFTAAVAVFWDANRSSWVVTGHLPAAPPDKEYQLWFVTAEGRKSGGLISTDASGHSFAVLEISPDPAKFTAMELTLEPRGGSSQPTSPVLATGKTG